MLVARHTNDCIVHLYNAAKLLQSIGGGSEHETICGDDWLWGDHFYG